VLTRALSGQFDIVSATLRALLKTSSDSMHIMQHVDSAVPRSAGNAITYRLNLTSGSFNMVMKQTYRNV
jgi:hypothetical protein